MSTINGTCEICEVALWCFLLGVEKFCEYSSPVTFVSNMFVVCGLVNYYIGMVSSARCVKSLIGIVDVSGFFIVLCHCIFLRS